ncbi:SCP2 sterol-binding domain-containing protein [Ornithinibacillus halotolerans]|uniref:SCP2 domain-containing protein n=1 Tax=Ornithinibacillus halotolerans TaxID=1274357 RepID=A0A916W6W8_9BACI|nr:SCP2 sterol-binding domain-containing protein [Ornithinibacillus halotolerans]GGA72463.1 hypothetical protein GCM10008025_15320 [Ornithinibacillus halotolerans]
MSEQVASLTEVMENAAKVLNANPTPLEGLHLTYQFDIKDEGVYVLRLEDGKAAVSEETTVEADCTLSMSLKSFQKFLAGKLNGTTAFMTGKLKIKGDIGKALKLESILKQYNFE